MPERPTDPARWIAANDKVRFHPVEQEGSLPCVELAGCLVFVYLDQEQECLCVSLDLDSTEEWLVHHDMVPIQVRIQDTVIADTTRSDLDQKTGEA